MIESRSRSVRALLALAWALSLPLAALAWSAPAAAQEPAAPADGP